VSRGGGGDNELEVVITSRELLDRRSVTVIVGVNAMLCKYSSVLYRRRVKQGEQQYDRYPISNPTG
jgi:hypothetical protein